METNKDYGLLALRVGLGLFILVWGLAKFVQKDMWVEMFPMLYWGVGVGTGILAVLGIIQILTAASLLTGWKVKYAAWIGFVVQALTALAIAGRILAPFGMVEGDPVMPNIVLFGTVPILTAWLALALIGKPGAYAVKA